jgi:hypothetical protein
MNPTIQGYLDACHEAEETVEEIQYSIARIRRELTALESKLVGARVNERLAKDTLARVASQEVIVEVTPRERDIAYMKGITLKVGDPLTDEAKREMFATPALARFSQWLRLPAGESID